MAKNQSPPPPELKVFADAREIESARRKLARRREEFQRMIDSKTRHDDPSLQPIEASFRNTILGIYGPNSPEFHRFKNFWVARNQPMFVDMSDRQMQANFDNGLPETVALVDGLLKALDESLEDLGGTSSILAGSVPHNQPIQSGGRNLLRRLLPMLFVDIAEFSKRMSQNEAKTAAGLVSLRTELIDPTIIKFGGRIANTAGDSVLAYFPSIMDSLDCAVEIQAGVSKRNVTVTNDENLKLRIGLHAGDALFNGPDLVGDHVNIASRVQTLADPGSVFISSAAKALLAGEVPYSFQDLGLREIKNMPSVQVARVYWKKQDGKLDSGENTQRRDDEAISAHIAKHRTGFDPVAANGNADLNKHIKIGYGSSSGLYSSVHEIPEELKRRRLWFAVEKASRSFHDIHDVTAWVADVVDADPKGKGERPERLVEFFRKGQRMQLPPNRDDATLYDWLPFDFLSYGEQVLDLKIDHGRPDLYPGSLYPMEFTRLRFNLEIEAPGTKPLKTTVVVEAKENPRRWEIVS